MKIIGNGSSALLFASHVLAYLTDDKLSFETLRLIELLRGKKLSKLDIEKEADQIIEVFNRILGSHSRFPYILIGAPSGGIAHFSMALGAPFLPCHFLKTPIYRKNWWFRSNDPDDFKKYFKRSLEVVTPIWKNNENCNVIIHYDPIHDRWIVSNGNTLRFKFRTLPKAYIQFIKQHLKKDGKIIFTNVQQTWNQYVIKDRIFFQVGGADGFQSEEFIEGSPKINSWLKKFKSKHRGGWDINQSNLGNYNIERRPESEWGNPPEFKDSTKEFCHAEGIDYLCISTDDYNLPGLLGTYSFYRKFMKSNLPPRGFDVEIYICGLNSTIARSRYLPIWLVFSPKGSLEYLQKFLNQIKEDFKDVPRKFLIVPFPTGFKTQKLHWPDSVLFSDWKKVVQKFMPNPDELQTLVYKDEIKTGIIGQAFKLPKIFKEAYKWGRKYPLNKMEPLNIEDIKWAVEKAKLNIED
ncbi:MAG: hypothetical protein ACTSRG_09605 [Candidatus Helarchaeota archaeon]